MTKILLYLSDLKHIYDGINIYEKSVTFLLNSVLIKVNNSE